MRQGAGGARGRSAARPQPDARTGVRSYGGDIRNCRPRKEGARMLNLPVDTSAMTFLIGNAAAEPIRERGTGRQKTDPDSGEPLYAVQLVVLTEGRADVITVKVPGAPRSELSQGMPVRVAGLVAVPWTMEGRSGVAFRAARVEPARPVPAKAS